MSRLLVSQIIPFEFCIDARPFRICQVLLGTSGLLQSVGVNCSPLKVLRLRVARSGKPARLQFWARTPRTSALFLVCPPRLNLRLSCPIASCSQVCVSVRLRRIEQIVRLRREAPDWLQGGIAHRRPVCQ